MDREWLARRLDEGASYEEVAREAGCSASKVTYWARRYGLSSCHAITHSARGGIDRDLLVSMIDAGMTVREIAEHVGFGPSTVRYWIGRHGLQTRAAERRARDRADRSSDVVRDCPSHGPTRHVFRDNRYRCARCASAAVSRRRRRIKATLIQEMGGACVLCGYAKCVAALHFHHIDPSDKRFAVSGKGVVRSLAATREEASKCVLLCANCHAEVENGLADLPVRSQPDPPYAG